MQSNRHKSRRRLYLPELQEIAGTHGTEIKIALSDDKTSHLKKVLRLDWEEELEITDGIGNLYSGVLTKFDPTNEKSRACIHVTGKTQTEFKTDHPQITLAIGMAKNQTMDWIIEKATECGATAIQPILCSRSVVKIDLNEATKYLKRWHAISASALEQCERLWAPDLKPILNWRDWLKHSSAQSSFKAAFLSETRNDFKDSDHLKKTFEQLSTAKDALLLIGPEGGFSNEEISDIRSHGFADLSLGRTVLRVETAVISALTLARTLASVQNKS